MKTFALIFLAGVLAVPVCRAADDATTKPKPYTLRTCIVSGEKLGGDMGDPYVFIYKDPKVKNDPGHELKFCCKSCMKDFNKDPAGYIKKLDEAEAKLAKK